MIRLTRRSVLLGATALSAAGFLPAGAARAQANRTYHALVVAVTKYPNLPEKLWLVGPNHDAALISEFLRTNELIPFQDENVTVLATDAPEGVKAKADPTHANITAAMHEIAAKAKPEDFIYLHFSGHGSRQVAFQGGEPDGYDEIFLPSDTGMWEGGDKPVPNAFVDNQMKAALDEIRATGAFVWIVFDCCHSGTMTRAVTPVDDSTARERKVEFSELIAEGARNAAAAAVAAADSKDVSRGLDEKGDRQPSFLLTAAATGKNGVQPGGIVAFYAAQTMETTPEMPLPKGVENATSYGLFTYTIFSKLAQNPNVSYRQLGDAVLQQYGAYGRQRPTPLFEGSGGFLDAGVMYTEPQPRILQWRIDVKDGRATIGAGKLHELADGAKLAIVPGANSDLADAIGYLSVQNAKTLTSDVVPVEFEGKPAVNVADIPAGAYARVTEVVLEFKLKVARPEAGEGVDAVNAMLDALAADETQRFSVELVEPGAEADIRLAFTRQSQFPGARSDAPNEPALYFLPASGDVSRIDGSQPPLVAAVDPERLKTGTADNLTKIFRAVGLSRLAANAGDAIKDVEVSFSILRMPAETSESLEKASVPRVHPKDQVHVKVTNGSKKLFDLNILYIGSDYSIEPFPPLRLESKSELNEPLFEFTDSSFGMERMVAVMTEAPPLSEMEDLSFLRQGGVPPVTRSAKGTGAAGAMSDALRDLGGVTGSSNSTRGVAKLSADRGPEGAVMMFQLETVPAAS